jgi:mRNA degradation ribonuclease J1/J2
MKLCGLRMLAFGTQIDFIYKMTENYKLEQKHAKNGFHKLGESVIAQKFKEFNERTHEEETEADEDLKTKKPQIFIDQLFKMNGTFSAKEMNDEANTIILTVNFSLLSIENLIQTIFSTGI